MQKQKYFSIRNLAWELLLECQITELPVDLYKIARTKHWHIVTEKQYSQNITKEIELHRDGNMTFIVHKEATNVQRLRFGIAHEFGHILLEHIVSEEEIEKEANIFAVRLLMPAIVLEKLRVTTAEEISELCNTSLESASYRLERLKELRQRQKFLTHPLEQELYKAFQKFIKKNL